MTEQETIQRAVMYLERLSEGVNPLNGEVIPEGEVLREPRISRCLKYAAEKLALTNEAEKKYSPKGFFILDVQLEALEPSKRSLTTTQLVDKINRVTEENEAAKFQVKWVLDWLVEQGLLGERDSGRYTTEAGKLLGITVEEYVNPSNQFLAYPICFTCEAQMFIFDHLREIAPQRRVTKPKKKRAAFFITELQKGQLSPLGHDCSISQLCAEINRITDENETYKFKAQWVNDWLIEIGMLEVMEGEKRATSDGNAVGITSTPRVNERGESYLANSYTPEAQSFILDNIDAILAFVADSEAQSE